MGVCTLGWLKRVETVIGHIAMWPAMTGIDVGDPSVMRRLRRLNLCRSSGYSLDTPAVCVSSTTATYGRRASRRRI